MTNISKRLLSMLLVVFMVISMLPTTVFAAEETETPVESVSEEEKGYILVIYNEDGTEAMTINGTKSGSEFKIASALADAYTFGNNAFLFGITGTPTYELTLLQDVETAEKVEIPAGKNVVVDLNGFDITSGYQAGSDTKHLYPFDVHGNMTIKDSEGTGSITGRGIYVQDGSKLTVESGAIYGIDSNGGSALFQYGGDIVINGGHVEQKATGTSNFAINAAAGTVTVNGGWVGGNHGAIAAGGAAVVINDGELVCTGTAGMTDNVLYTYGTGTITVNGGTFVGDSDIASGGCCVYDANGGATINGGNFSKSSGGDVWGTTGTTITGGTFENLIETKHVTVGSTIVNGGKTYTMTENGTLAENVSAAVKIGNQGYETLADALAAAKTMTGDVTVEIYDKVTLNSALFGSFNSIKFVGKDADAEIYLDVQGYTTATGKKVAFEDLTLSKAEGGYVANAGFMNVAFGIYDVAEVTYTNCTFANGACAGSGKVTYTGCTFKRSWDKYGLWAYGDVDVTVDGCTFADYRGIKMYAEGMAKTVDLTVKNTDFSAVNNKPAIVLTCGERVTLEGNTYSSTGVFELDLDGAPNGTTVTSADAITCVNDNGACGVLVDGKIYTTVAQAAEVATSGSTVTLLHNSTETVELAKGVILDKNGFDAAGITVEPSVVYVAKIVRGAVYDSEMGFDSVVNAGTNPKETLYFETLRAAFEAAQDGETIDLLCDVTLITSTSNTAFEIAGGRKLTLDLHGFKINADFVSGSTTNHQYAFANNADLTIAGKGEINARGIFNYGSLTLEKATINTIDGNGGYGVRNYSGASFTMNGGVIAATKEDGDAPGAGFDATPVRVDAGATAVINGGKLNNVSNYTTALENYGTTTINYVEAYAIHSTITNDGTLTIQDGKFVNDGLENITAHVIWAAGGTTTVNGGTFDGKDNYNGFNIDASAGATVNVTGGKFLSVHSGSLYGEGKIAVSGGSFFDKVAEKYCAENYIPTANNDGTYGVVYHVHVAGTPVEEKRVEATCTANGSYDSVVYCTDCNRELSRGTVTITALGHDKVTHGAKAPTCTEIGWDAYETCSRCDHTTYVEKAALGHAYTYTQKDENNHTVGCSECDYTADEAHSVVGESCDKCGYIAIVYVAQVGETKYETFLKALQVAVDTGASEIKALSDVREKMEADFDIKISADLTITADQPVKLEFYNEGTTRDFAVGSTNNNTLTIAENVSFDLVDRVIWLGFWGNNVDVVVEGYLGGYQIWHGTDTTVTATGILDSHGEAFVMRRNATLTVNGGKVNANYFSIYSGHIEAEDATITAGLVWIANNHNYGGEGTVSFDLDNTNFTSRGEVKVLAGEGKTVEITLTNGSTLTAAGALTTNEGAIIAGDASSSFTARNKNVFVAEVNGMQYASLQAAMAAAENGDTIVLMDDIALDTSIKNTKQITLDLNGKTITGTDKNTSGNFYLINNVGELTVTGNGTITLVAEHNREWNASSVVIANNPGGKLIVENGTIEHLGGSAMAYGIDNLTNGKGTYAETVINGGNIKSTYRAVRQFLNGIEAQNILTINGGVIEGANKSVWMQDPSKNANSGELTISENATLKGDVYLYVTAGSTEWPVAVSIATAALADGSAVLTGNVPYGYIVEQSNGNWGVREANYVAEVNGEYFATFAEAVKKIATDGTDTTIKLLNDIELTESIDFQYGTGKIIFTADKPVTVKQTKLGLDLGFTIGNDTPIVIDENVTFEIYDNASGMYIYYGPSLNVKGAIVGGQNWGCLYLFYGDHVVAETGKIGVGRVQSGFNTVTVYGEVDTNYLLIEGGKFIADGAVIDAVNVHDSNNGGMRWGASTFTIKNGSTVNAGTVTLGYAESVLSIDATSKLTAKTIKGAGKIIIDATGMTAGEVATITGDVSGFTGTLEVINNPALYAVVENGKIVLKSYAAKIGNVYYETINEALAAVQEGETIELLAGVTISEGTVKMPAELKDVTIKGAEGAALKDTTLMAADGNSLSYVGLTIDGVVFDNSRISITGWRNNGVIVEDLTVTNCEFKNLNDTTNSACVHINMAATEPVNGFTFSNNVIDGATGGSKSGVYAQVTGEVNFTGNVINNVAFRPFVIQITTDDGVADEFIVTGNTFSGSAAGRTQGLGNNAAGTDTVKLVVSENIFKGITNAQQICYWNFNEETTTADLSKNYYDIDILATPDRIYFNSPAQDAEDLIEMGVFPYYADEAKTQLVEAPAIMVTYADGTVEYFDDMRAAVPHSTNVPKLEGATITLLQDMSGLGMRLMENGMVFDLNGHTYTLTGGTGSKGTETSGFQIRPEVTETATIKNGTIKIAEGVQIIWMFNNYATNFVVEDVTVDCANMAYSYGESCYVYVSRADDNAQFIGTTNIINFNAAVAGNAINVADTMTIGENVVPGGSIELEAGATLTGPEGLDVVTVDGYRVAYANGVYTSVCKTATVMNKAELDAALASAIDGDTIILGADIDYGTTQLAITKAITLDLGGKTLSTRNAYGGMSVKGNPTIKNGTIVHASNTAAIKVWNAAAFEDLVIDVQGKGDANKTIGGIVLQSGSTTCVGSIKNVTIKGDALTNGIETYNCGDAAANVIGSMENVTINAKGTGMLISAPCGTATNCSITGGTTGIEIWIKGNYSATLDLVDCEVNGGKQAVFAHDEFSSNPSIVNNGTLKLTANETTTFESANNAPLTLTIARAENVVTTTFDAIIETCEAKIGDTYYASLQDAVNAAQTGETITVLDNIVLIESLVIAADDKIILNLNGKTISQEKACTESYEMINNKGNLTITGNGKISFTDTSAGDPSFGWGSYTLRNEGTLVVENGTIAHLGQQNQGSVKHMYCAIFQYSGSTTINGGTISTPTYRSVRLWMGDMTINGGNFEGQVWVQAVDNSAKLTITDGSFAPRGVDGSSVFVGNITSTGVLKDVELNVIDGNFATKIGANNAEAVKGDKIVGGTFTETAKNGTNEALLGACYVFVENADGTYGVEEKVELPEVEVTELKGTDLTFALNFAIKNQDKLTDAYLQKLFAAYGDHYVDYVLTIDGLTDANVTFNANGGADGYLAGQYDAWSKNWVNVPFEDVTINNGDSLYIMEYAAKLMGKQGLRFTLQEVAEIVKDFDCGIYFTDEFLRANPNMKVTLQLKVFTEDAQGNKIEDVNVATKVFEAPAVLPEVEVTELKGTDLTFALNFAIKNQDKLTDAYLQKLFAAYGDHYVDYVLTIEGLTEQNVTFNANGGADGYLAGQYDAWSKNWVNVPFEDVTINNGDSLYIMEYAAKLMGKQGLRFTLQEVAEIVKDFDCGIYFTDEFLRANPDMKVTLQLKVFTEDAQGNKIEDMNVATKVFEAPAVLPEVVITDIKDSLKDTDPDLSVALNFAIKDQDKLTTAYLEKLFAAYGDRYVDYVLTIKGLTDANVTFNANGTADGYLAGQYDAWSENWVNVPFEDVTINNGDSLYIMEYAAKLMGKQGLRFTLEEVAEIVKNFDCGIYFTPEFLAANPDLEVTLELKVFEEDAQGNKINDISVAEETFTIPEMGYVAQNVQTGKLYTTVAQAMAEVVTGETVKLLTDVEENITVLLYNKVKLDLNGYKLKVNYVIAAFDESYIIDSTDGKGLLIIAKKNLSILGTNEQLPVWFEGEGFRFTTIKFVTYIEKDDEYRGAGSARFYFWFEGKDGCFLDQAIENGGLDKNIYLSVKVTYTINKGTMTSQYFVFTEQDVKDYAVDFDWNAFVIGFQGLDAVEDVKFQAAISYGEPNSDGIVLESEIVEYN